MILGSRKVLTNHVNLEMAYVFCNFPLCFLKGQVRVYENLREMCDKLSTIKEMDSDSRLFGTYFRIGFYGEMLLGTEHKREYIYKEPKIVHLPEVCERLQNVLVKRFGRNSVRVITESGPVNTEQLNKNLVFIQITHVVPYFEQDYVDTSSPPRLALGASPESLSATSRPIYECHTGVSKFMFEMPYLEANPKKAAQAGSVELQCRRRYILTSAQSSHSTRFSLLVLSFQLR